MAGASTSTPAWRRRSWRRACRAPGRWSRRSTTSACPPGTATSAPSGWAACWRPSPAPERRPAAGVPGRPRRRRAAPDRLRRPQRRRRADRGGRAPRRAAAGRGGAPGGGHACAGSRVERDDPLRDASCGLGDDAAGIMVLDGRHRRRARRSPTCCRCRRSVLELEITSNRPDCLAVYGVAREVHAVTGAAAARRSTSPTRRPRGRGGVADHAAVEVRAPDLCPRYMARVLTDVRVGPSPAWLRGRLEAAGMRSISNVVDITNYAMLLTGAAAARLRPRPPRRAAGGRRAGRGDGERIVTLDGQERTLDSVDARDLRRRAAGRDRRHLRRRVRRGGGGRRPGCCSRRRPSTARRSSTPRWRSGLRTESSARFEKGLPRELPPRAMAIACRLLVELCRRAPGAGHPRRPRPAARAAAGDDAPRAACRACSASRSPPEESAAILTRLGCEVAEASRRGADGARCRSSAARDLTREIDLIEEVGAHPRPRRDPGRDAARRRAGAGAARRRRSSTGSSGSPPTSACPRRSPTTSCPRPTPTRCASPPTTRAATSCASPTR